MAQKNSPAVLVEVVGIVSSDPSIVVRQHTPRFTNDVADAASRHRLIST